MRRRRQILVLITLATVAIITQVGFAQLHLDADTGKWIKDGFDVSIFAQIPGSPWVNHLAFGKGGTFGNDMYTPAGDGNIYRIDSSGQVSVFASLPTTGLIGIDFPNLGSGFGDYIYVGSPDGYYGGNRNIYRVDGSGTATVFFDGTNFGGGTTNAIKFAPEGSPYGNYLFTQDDSSDQIYRIAPDGSATTFSSGIPLAIDFVFDTHGQFDNQLLAVNIEKGEHGSHYNTIYKVGTDGTKTTLLGDVFHMGDATLTPPSSAFGGKLYIQENYWPRMPTDIYAVGSDGSHELFAQNFRFWDGAGLEYGPDGALYTMDQDTGTIYRIAPELIDANIDIKAKNLNSKSHRLLQVLVFGAADLDVSEIDLLSLELAGAAPTGKGKSDIGSFKDANGDSLADLLLYFAVQDMDLAGSPTELILNGLFNDGTALAGSDTIRMVGPGDANGDSVVSAGDYASVQANFGNVAPTMTVPEPVTMSLLAIGGLAIIRRRRN
jgi:hypothetical protein